MTPPLRLVIISANKGPLTRLLFLSKKRKNQFVIFFREKRDRGEMSGYGNDGYADFGGQGGGGGGHGGGGDWSGYGKGGVSLFRFFFHNFN